MKIEQFFSRSLPKGMYYIGDLSYLLEEDIYEDIIFSPLTDGSIVKITNEDGEKVLLFSANTFDGDGVFKDQHGDEYSVDNGNIGIVQLYNEDITFAARQLMKDGLANIVEFGDDFDVSANDGVFNFGHIEIDTKYEEENTDNEDEECDRWDDDEY